MHTLNLGFVTAFTVTYLAIPAIIMIAKEHHLYDKPNERSSHETPTPSLGGIGIFGGLICGTILWAPYQQFGTVQYVIAALMLLFLVGVRDDLTPVSPTKKFVVQLLAALILTYKAGVRVTDWWGILGIHELPETFSYIFSLVAIVGVVNAFNLIDGINGLAATLGMIASLVFGIWFFKVGQLEWAVVALSMVGALVAFLNFNLTPAKIFMGDTGSLCIGMVSAVLALQFVETNLHLPPNAEGFMPAAPAVAVSVLILPLYDTIRVFARRMAKGHSPFHADKTHIHHILLDCGLSHVQATACLLGVTTLFIGVALSLQELGCSRLLMVQLFMAFGLNLLLVYLAKRKNVQRVNLS